VPDRRVSFLVRQAALALACGGVATAGEPKQTDPAADAELLEFLGSVDSGADSQTSADDASWIDYLSQTDITKVAKTTEPHRTDAPPESGDKKHE